MVIVIIGLARAGDAALNAARNEIRSARAQYAAESGVADALVKLESDPSATSGSGSLPVITKGVPVESYSYTIYKSGAALPAPAKGAVIPTNCVFILSTGTFQGISRKVGVTVKLVEDGQGVLSGAYYAASLEMSGNSSTDSYDSSKGHYAAGSALKNGDITTNSTAKGSIQMSGNATVKGTVHVGVGGTVGPASGKNTSGSAYTVWMSGNASSLAEDALEKPVTLPAVTIPSLGASKGNISAKKSGASIAPGNYGKVTASGGGTLSLSAGTYVMDSLKLSGNAKLVTTGAVKIYIQSSLDLTGGSTVNSSLKPANLVFMLADGSSAKVSGGSDAAMVVYGPKASITVSGNADIFGAIVGNEVTATGGATIHFDEALKSFSLDGSSGSSGSRTILSWQRF